MKKTLAGVGAALLLAGCAGQEPSASSGTLTQQAFPPTLTLGLSVQASRERLQETTTRHTWELTKTVHDDGDAATAAFDVTATLSTTSATAITDPSKRTVVTNDQPLSICNTGPITAHINTLDVQLVGFDSASVALAPTVDLTGLFPALPISISPGNCVTASFSVDSIDPSGSTPPLTTAQATMLQGAAQFGLTYTVQASSGATALISPAITTTNASTTIGDASVTLADPTFGYSQTMSASTSQLFKRTFSCDDKAGLVAVPGSTTEYTLPNTATLTGPSTNLSASATDNVHLNCAPPPPPPGGCTFTQGYYKTHAEYFGGLPNNKYDPAAWAGARDWNGSQTSLLVGGATYTQSALVTLYNKAVKGNQALALFHQLATAKLNTLKQPTSATPAVSTASAIAAADAWFASNPNWQSGTYSGNPSQWISTLDAFNNGADSMHCQ